MPYNGTALGIAKMLMLSATGMMASMVSLATQVGGATKVAQSSVHAQLQQTHDFLYLDIPLWWFFVASVVLSFAGAFLALTTDTLKGEGSVIGKVTTAILVGLIATFVFLPAVAEEPNVVAMMLTSLGGSFSGTVLLYILAQLVKDEELLASTIAVLKIWIKGAVEFAVSLLPWGGKK